MSEDVTGAVLSVMATPNSQDKESAEKVVNDVWESCFKDVMEKLES